MNFQQWVSLAFIVLLAAYLPLLPAWFYFFRVPEMQRETLKYYAPIAASQIDKNKMEADLPLAVAFVAKCFWRHRLWPLHEDQIREAIKAELRAM